MKSDQINFTNEKSFRSWLNDYVSSDQEPDYLIQRFISGINILGIDVYRSSMWLPTSHPELWGTQLIWTKDTGVEIFRRDHSITSTPIYLNTPGEAVHKTRRPIQWKLDVDEKKLPYPLLHDVKKEGGTDYLIVPFHTDHEKEQPWITFATKQTCGFSTIEINTLKQLCVPLSWKARVTMAKMASKSLLSVYLGKNAAERVIAGEFKRGTGEKLNSIIWFSDLRGFTALGDSRSAEELVEILDQYFECISEPIEEFNGEILKFIGDAVLAIFPISHSQKNSCKNALLAAEKALMNLAAWSRHPTRPQLKSGVALHIGEVLYGNIGGSSRLDFTVIGSAVNEASRVEALCKTSYPLLATDKFAQYLDPFTMVSIGMQKLRGVNQEHEIFTLPKYIP